MAIRAKSALDFGMAAMTNNALKLRMCNSVLRYTTNISTNSGQNIYKPKFVGHYTTGRHVQKQLTELYTYPLRL
jgi:hypothetical protein